MGNLCIRDGELCIRERNKLSSELFVLKSEGKCKK